MHILTPEAAQELLQWARAQNPGPWADHSQTVGRAAFAIAARCGMDARRASALGLIHDIGRYRRGDPEILHILDGYRLMRERGYEQAAQICLTHSFPSQALEEYGGNGNCAADDKQALRDALAAAEYTDYDRLIQLCDSLALPNGICLMEKRLVDVAIRHGANAHMIGKWKRYFGLLGYFQSKMDAPFYSLFPEAVEVTFGAQL